MAGNLPDLKTYIKTEDGLKELVAEWRQSKGQLTGKIKVTEGVAAPFVPGAELKVSSFPNTPRRMAAPAPDMKPAA